MPYKGKFMCHKLG